MPPKSVVEMAVTYMPAWLRQRAKAKRLDVWARGEQERDELYIPPGVERGGEYDDIAERARSPWMYLVITSVLQTMFVEGVRMPGSSDNLQSWAAWQQNDFDEKQVGLYRSMLGQGVAYVEALPGKDSFTGDARVIWTPRSAVSMAAFFQDDDPEWPTLAIHGVEQRSLNAFNMVEDGFAIRLIDDQAVHYLACRGEGLEAADWTYLEYREHNAGVCPVIEYPCMTDLDGRAMSEIEPLIPLARRIDQNVFDRLIVQRYGAWKVRYITGLVRPQGMTEQQYQAAIAQMKIGDFLVSPSTDTKFGQLDEMDLKKLLEAGDSDLRTLSAISQTPPHHMLGLSSNLQAESLAAAEAGLQRRSFDRRVVVDTRHERLMRLTAKYEGNREEMRAFDMQVRWKDMESRSLSQAADALGKLATQVGVPTEMLFEKIPGWTDSDVHRAMQLVESQAVDKLLAELATIAQQNGATGTQMAQQGTGQPQPTGAAA